MGSARLDASSSVRGGPRTANTGEEKIAVSARDAPSKLLGSMSPLALRVLGREVRAENNRVRESSALCNPRDAKRPLLEALIDNTQGSARINLKTTRCSNKVSASRASSRVASRLASPRTHECGEAASSRDSPRECSEATGSRAASRPDSPHARECGEA